jgi:hypothetical protein
MNKIIYIVFLTISLVFISCANTTDPKEKPKMGEKGGVCYNTLTCNYGLICIDMVCEDDPCYNIKCDTWKTCEDGICKLKANRCERNEDCAGEGATCDVMHNCISDTDPCDGVTCSGAGK